MKPNLLFIAVIFTATSLFSSGPCQAAKTDHGIFDRLLAKYVSDGMVDYISWKADDLEAFREYVDSLEDININGWMDDEKKAFWINAYNAITIYAVLERIPKNRILSKAFSVMMIPGFFNGIKYKVAGEDLTLNEIENDKLLAGFGDPRIHFVIVCASRSCPGIQERAFIPEGLDDTLDEATRGFLSDNTKNRLDKERGVLYLSNIFKWYKNDFVEDFGSLEDYVKRYIDPKDTEYIEENRPGIKFLYYDWFVNIKR